MNAEDAKTQSCMDEYLGKTKPKKVCPKCGKVVTEDGCGCKKGAAAKDCGTATGDAWEENKHKRAADGKFTKGGEGVQIVEKAIGRKMTAVENAEFVLFKIDSTNAYKTEKQIAEAWIEKNNLKKIDNATLRKGVVGMQKEQASKIIADYMLKKIKGVERVRDESRWERGQFCFELEFPKLGGKEVAAKREEIRKAFGDFFPADVLDMHTPYGDDSVKLHQFIDYTRLTVKVPSLRELRANAESAKASAEMYDKIGAKLDDANAKGIKVTFSWNEEPKFTDKKLANDAEKFEQLRQTYSFKANGMNSKIREMESKSILSVVEKAYKGGDDAKTAVAAWNKEHTRKDEKGVYVLDEAETEAGATYDAAEDCVTVPMDVAAFDECEAKKAMEHFAKLEPIAEKKEGTCPCKLKKLIAKAEKDGDAKRKDAYVHLLADANDAKIAEAQYAQKSDKDLKTLLESYKSNVASSAEWAAWAKKNGKPDNMTQEQFDAFTIRQKDYGEQMGLHVKAIERVLAKRKKDGVDVGDAWEESKHPRNHGKFAKIGEGDKIASVLNKDGNRPQNLDDTETFLLELEDGTTVKFLAKDKAKAKSIANDISKKIGKAVKEVKQSPKEDIKKSSAPKTAEGNTKESAAAYVSKLTDEQIERGIKNANFELGKKGISESDKVVWKHGLEMLNAEKARRSKK